MTIEFDETVTVAQALAVIELEAGLPPARVCLIVAGACYMHC